MFFEVWYTPRDDETVENICKYMVSISKNSGKVVKCKYNDGVLLVFDNSNPSLKSFLYKKISQIFELFGR